MRVLQVGLGNQGRKRCAVAGRDIVGRVDPVNPEAEYKSLHEAPVDFFDAAIISTPDALKLSLAEYLISKGKHVLVEKPLLARDDRQIIGIASLARSTGAVCYTAYNHRFEPNIKALKSLLDSSELGSVYVARLFYGNGTARNVKSSWRDEGFGVLSDLGSHLIDLSAFLFGAVRPKFVAWSLKRFENRAFDHILLGSLSFPSIQIEATYLSWRNTFAVDVLCELGSAHVRGLCKWGPSTFVARKRVFPSGTPHEVVKTEDGPDPTWAEEYRHFKQLCGRDPSSLENDLWINSTLNGIVEARGEKLPS